MESQLYLAEAKVTGYGKKEWLGTIDVRLLGVESEGMELEHVRVLTRQANEQAGCCILPQIDDLVLLLFTDPNRCDAICLGSTIPINAPLVKECKEDNAWKQIKTVGGFLIQWSDEKDKEQLLIQSKQGLKLLLDENMQQISLGQQDGKQLVCIDRKEKRIDLKAEEAYTVVCQDAQIAMEKGNMKLKAKDLMIECTNLQVKAQKNCTIKGVSTSISASDQLKLEGSQCEVNGKMKLGLKGMSIQLG